MRDPYADDRNSALAGVAAALRGDGAVVVKPVERPANTKIGWRIRGTAPNGHTWAGTGIFADRERVQYFADHMNNHVTKDDGMEALGHNPIRFHVEPVEVPADTVFAD